MVSPGVSLYVNSSVDCWGGCSGSIWISDGLSSPSVSTSYTWGETIESSSDLSSDNIGDIGDGVARNSIFIGIKSGILLSCSLTISHLFCLCQDNSYLSCQLSGYVNHTSWIGEVLYTSFLSSSYSSKTFQLHLWSNKLLQNASIIGSFSPVLYTVSNKSSETKCYCGYI